MHFKIKIKNQKKSLNRFMNKIKNYKKVIKNYKIS